MPEWRFTPEGESVFSEWDKTAPGRHRELMAELLESIADGSWEGRWRWEPNPTYTDVVEIWPEEYFLVSVRAHLDEHAPVWWIEPVRIYSDVRQL